MDKDSFNEVEDVVSVTECTGLVPALPMTPMRTTIWRGFTPFIRRRREMESDGKEKGKNRVHNGVDRRSAGACIADGWNPATHEYP